MADQRGDGAIEGAGPASAAQPAGGSARHHDLAEQRLARHIVRRMGETGQPPERGALRVNVGTDEILEALRREYLELIRDHGVNSTFKLVQGPFGGGKSQFLCSFREIAWQEGFVTALVSVSPKECPFDDMRRIYQQVAAVLSLPPESEHVDPIPGIEFVLRCAVEKRLETGSEEDVREWLDRECLYAPVESHAWRRAATLYMRAVVHGHAERADVLASWLRGEPVLLREVQELGIRETLAPETAFRWLRSLVQFLRFLDFPGVVLMFDEMDRVVSISRRRRREIGDNLRQLIDACGQSVLPGAVLLYAVPPEFMTSVVPEYPALQQRLKGVRTFSRTCPVEPIIDLEALPMTQAELLRAIGTRLLELYCTAYPDAQLDKKLQSANLEALARETAAFALESGVRRTFVRAVVAMLSEQHHGGQKPLDDADVRRLAGSADGGEGPALGGEEPF